MKDQVLNIEQIQELIDLGFDVSKYSSIWWKLTKNDFNYNINEEEFIDICLPFQPSQDNLINIANKKIKLIPTLTTGDIINILPDAVLIEEEDNRIFRYALLETDMKTFLRYVGFGRIIIEIERKDNFIDMLFDLLKYCIISKHI